MPQTLEGLAKDLAADPEFVNLPQSSQDHIFATLAVDHGFAPLVPQEKSAFSYPAAKYLMQVVGAVGGGILGGLAESPTVVGIPSGVAAGSAAGMTGMEALREKLAHEPISPANLGITFGTGLAFPYVAKPAAGLVAGVAEKLIPGGIASLGEGGVLNQAISSGLASMGVNAPVSAGYGFANAPPGTSIPGRLESAAGETGRELGPSFVGGLLPGAAFGAGNKAFRVFSGADIPPQNTLINKAEQVGGQMISRLPPGPEQPTPEGPSSQFDPMKGMAKNVLQSAATGELEGPLVNATKVKAEGAWELMRQVGKEVKDPTVSGEVVDEFQKMFPDDPVRVQNAIEAAVSSAKAAGLKGFFPERVGMQETGASGSRQMQINPEDLQAMIQQNPEGIAGSNVGALKQIEASKIRNSATAAELIEMATEAGRKIAPSYRAGTSSLAGDDLPFVDVRTAIANILERKAPPELKGAVSQAKQNWMEFVRRWREPLNDYLAPGRTLEPSAIQARINRLAAAANDPQSEGARFLREVEGTVGKPIITPMQEAGMSAQGAQQAQGMKAESIKEEMASRRQFERQVVPDLLKIASGKADDIILKKYGDLETQTGVQIIKPLQQTFQQIDSARNQTMEARSMAKRVAMWTMIYPLVRKGLRIMTNPK